MASSPTQYLRERERSRFLEQAFDFDETYRQALARVQFMKTRYEKFYEPEDENYSLYIRAKRLVSKFEYNNRQMDAMTLEMALAKQNADADAHKAADKKYEQHMKNCLYYAFGIGELYTKFVREAPVASV